MTYSAPTGRSPDSGEQDEALSPWCSAARDALIDAVALANAEEEVDDIEAVMHF
jgi:hypothetical protein